MTRNIKWLQKFCIPSPVSGGLVFSIATLILYKVFHIELSFDGTLKDVFMLAFFTSVGFQSNLKVLRQGGKTLVLMLVLLVGIIVLQNVMPLIITKILDVNPLIGMAAVPSPWRAVTARQEDLHPYWNIWACREQAPYPWLPQPSV